MRITVIFCILLMAIIVGFIVSEPERSCDGVYAVLPWDTYPEFGKIKPVRSCIMSIANGAGEICINYDDGSSYFINVQITRNDGKLQFYYKRPGNEARSGSGEATVPLKRNVDCLEIFYCNRWFRFAKMVNPEEYLEYPHWPISVDEGFGRQNP